MYRRVVILILAAVLLATGLSAATVGGSVGKGGSKTWGFVPNPEGQTLITLSWNKRTADLFMVLVCDIDGAFESVGVGAAVTDRIQRIEVGVASDSCVVGVSSFGGQSGFNLNLQSALSKPLGRLEGGTPPAAFEARLGASLAPLAPGEAPAVERLLARLAVERR